LAADKPTVDFLVGEGLEKPVSGQQEGFVGSQLERTYVRHTTNHPGQASIFLEFDLGVT